MELLCKYFEISLAKHGRNQIYNLQAIALTHIILCRSSLDRIISDFVHCAVFKPDFTTYISPMTVGYPMLLFPT